MNQETHTQDKMTCSAMDSPKLENSQGQNTSSLNSSKSNVSTALDTYQPRYVKVCTLYKTILRRFRSFLRERFDRGRKMSLYQHWTEYMYLKNMRNFMDDIKLPQDLKNQDNTLKLLTIIFPSTIMKIRPHDCIGERKELVNIFRENCSNKRLKFFQDPLVKYLWNELFMRDRPDIFEDHLRQIKSDSNNGENAIVKFVTSLNSLEQNQIQFSTDGSKVKSCNVEIFNQAEKHDYLVKNGKYNKRQTVKVKRQI